MPKFAAVETCPCETEGLASSCFSDLHARGESCLCVETALMREDEQAGDYPTPLPS